MSRRICIVSHAAYRAFTEGALGHIGGVERQTSLLAKWLAVRGHAVDLVTWDEGGRTGDRLDGVRLVTVCRRDDGVRGVRFFHPRWSSLVAALRQSNADIYYHNTAECVTGQIALWCRMHRRAFVFSAASHADCDAALPCLPTRRERMLYRLGLRFADAVIVQTGTQRDLMRAGFGRDAQVIPMPSPEPRAEDILPPDAGPPSRRLLWVGRLCDLKRPELLLDVAAAAPDLQFDIAGPVEDAAYGRSVLERASMLANVTYHGAVAPSAMTALYRRAGALVCTSRLEGFPNTFLEAWALGLPVVSTWDPDDVIAQRGLGRACAGSPEAIAAAVRGLFDTPGQWGHASTRARGYYMSTHRPEVTFQLMERVLVGAGVNAGDAPAVPSARGEAVL
jgi:glycosyltransferase involved in cell wall biosynthesis